jgi:hypothetical protein
MPRRFEALRESSFGQRIAEHVARLRSTTSSAEKKFHATTLGNGYSHEAAHLMECVAAGRSVSDVLPLAQSVEILEIVDLALGQVRGAA